MQELTSSLVEALRQRGMRVTPQRAIIFEAIENLEGHITAEEIFQAVQKINPYISLATVYRTLELLQELNLRKIHRGLLPFLQCLLHCPLRCQQ